MKRKSLTLEQRSEMLCKRINNELSYEESIQVYNLSPHQYQSNIRKAVEELCESGKKNKVIDDMLVFDNARKNRDFGNILEDNSFCSLFEMSEETISQSYLNLLNGSPKLNPGLQISPKNCYVLLKVVFNHIFPGFCNMSRDEQIKIVDSNVKATYDSSNGNGGIERWLSSHRLAGFINQGPYSSDRSPYQLIRWFDDKLSKEKNQLSWFDLTEIKHLHPWEFKRDWSDDNLTYMAIKHCIEENIPHFKESSRDEQVKLIEKNIFSKGRGIRRSRKFFDDCGLSGMVRQKFKYSVNVIEFFDKRYSEERGQSSYFDKKEQFYLEREKCDKNSDRLNAVESQGLIEPQAL